MAGFTEMVKKNLRESGADSETLELWDRITEWFDKGRPDAVEQSIRKEIIGIKSVASGNSRKRRRRYRRRKRGRPGGDI